MATEKEIQQLLDERRKRFRILVCIDGTDESYKGLAYAARLGQRPDSDIILLYVRPVDQGLHSGGLQVRVARENMLEWGLELPGIQYLKKGRDMLFAEEDADKWSATSTHTDAEGDPLGDNKIEYTNAEGRSIVLKLKTASNIATGILDQYELGPYNLIILGTSGRWGGLAKGFWDPAVADKVAMYAPCSVMVARDLEMGKGHLVCTDGSKRSLEMMAREAEFSSRLGNAVSLLSVALDVEGEAEAGRAVAEAKARLEGLDIPLADTFTRVGNPVTEIIELGKDFSAIVLADTGKTAIKRFFMGSVAFKVMEHAPNSVMILR